MISEAADLVGGIAAAGLWAARSAITGKILPAPPMLTHADKRLLHVAETVEYGEGLQLDIWTSANPVNAPVFLFIPGGGWILGQRRPQGYALMSHLVEQGWVCVAIDYRVAPRHKWPTPFDDVLQAYTWVRNSIHRYGGDAGFVAIGGASAGGHMAALAGLTWDHHPPDAVVGLYGSYDWEFRQTPYRQVFMRYLETVVVGKKQADHPHIFREASPMAQIHADAPPFLLVHGSADRLCLVGEARRFANALANVADYVDYHEIEGAPHAFDLMNPGQTAGAVDVIHDFLSNVRATNLEFAS